jgi:hypothetical protein
MRSVVRVNPELTKSGASDRDAVLPSLQGSPGAALPAANYGHQSAAICAPHRGTYSLLVSARCETVY